MLVHSRLPPLYRRFQQAAQRNPDKLALVVGESRQTYRELLKEVDALADGLANAGLRSGEHIGVLLPNCPEFVLLLLAGARLGSVIVPQSLGFSPEALANAFRAADIGHLVAWAGAADSLDPRLLAGKSILLSIGGAVEGWLGLAEILASGRPPPPSLPLPGEDLPYLLVLTSGATGNPKPIVLSQHTKCLRAEAAAGLYGVNADDVIMAATPLYHSLAQRLVLMSLISGGTSVLMAHFSPAAWIENASRHQVSFSIAVSSQLKQILNHLVSTGESLPSLRCLVSSSAVLDEETKRQLLARLKGEFHECYGTSEIAIATNLTPTAARRKLGSVGMAIPGTELMILGDDGKQAPTGTAGEILCRTPMLYSGYYGQAQSTTAARWGDFFRTGDLGTMDDEGFLYFRGRIKDIIITGGVNVYPKDIEEVIASHPGVRECAAIPLLDDDMGEVAGVVIAFNDPANPPSLRDIQRLCMQRLGDFQQPRRFFVVADLPKNGMGKVDKPTLRQTYCRSMTPVQA
ncbi:MAG: acyl--CoA ligase [Candidatus Accumulibacter sp.]|jgi:long-chain acyl-CoA synthetase|uniref:class I adenylate-forming enzyme family protein n=1 Tax=Accumulibacter sp. TaxID=2053492 RepID=UPI00258B2220|nr:class I adenylate-forming enzyme family protein [Accumulibacter sp.]MBK8117205.1 acyl--CoA ligase [Accumulibacter sp.]